MTKDLHPYPTYEPSGVPWLGDVPAHWEVRRLKTLCSMKSGEGITAESIESAGEYPVYGGNGLRGYASSYTHNGAFALIGRQGALCGNVHIARGQFWASEHAVVATLDRGHVLEWFGVILRVVNLNQYSIAAAQPGLAVERVLNLQLLVPPIQEQATIVRYLDHVGRRVRRLVRAKRKLITLLTEQKQAIINRAVTRGLDPNVPLKDSGVEWLGQVPEHWEVRRAKYIFRRIDERSRTGDEELLTVSSANGVIPRRTTSVTMFEAESYVGHKLCWPDDLVINSLWAWGRGLGFSTHHGIVSTAYGVYRLRSRDQADPRYLDKLVRSTPFHWELRVRSKGIWISRLQLTDESFLGSELPLPPLLEQAAIVEHIEEATAEIDVAIAHANREVDLLEEYRVRLVADVVTGQLDVREAAATIPDEDSLDVEDELDDVLDLGAGADLGELGAVLEESGV